MTSELQDPQAQQLRSDLAAIVIDGDIVVYDALQGGSHVLAGGAVAVWMALEDGGVPGVVERVADAVGLEPAVLSDEIDSVLSTFRTLGFFVETQSSDDSADELVVGE
jgi:hypothetical protein